MVTTFDYTLECFLRELQDIKSWQAAKILLLKKHNGKNEFSVNSYNFHTQKSSMD